MILPTDQFKQIPDFPTLPEAVENSSDCITIVDMQGTVLYVNVAGACQLDIESDPLPATLTWSSLWSPECVDLAEYGIESARSGRACRFQSHRRSATGGETWWDVAVTPMMDDLGNAVHMLCIARDITEFKRTALESRRALVTEINHRTTNSLTAVASLLSMQARRTADDAVRRSLQQARSRVIAVAEVHHRLHEIDGTERVDVGECISAVARAVVAAMCVDRSVRLELDCPRGVELRAERAIPIALAATELITNSMKHAFGGRSGLLHVSLTASGAHLVLCVRDDGSGLPKGFDEQRSSGVGMQVVMSLVRQLRGRLTIARLDQGSEFRVTLPIFDGPEMN